MIGFEFKENLKGLSCMQKTDKSFCEFITGLFYAYVFDTQASSNSPQANKSIHPIIHETAVTEYDIIERAPRTPAPMG